MDNEKLVAICRHELRLEEDHDIARLIQEVKRLQDDSSDTYARLTKQHRVKAREILSGYMLAWEYVEDLDGSRLWHGKMCRPGALLWPEDKKKILAGVEKLFNEFQDYWIIDRQKRKPRPTPKDHKEAGAGVDPSPLIAQSTTRSLTERTGRRDKYPNTDVAPVPDCVAPVAQDTELDERASGQKEEPEKAVSKESYHADPDTQLGGTEDEEFTEVSPCKKRALTPPYIPGMGILQTWPKFRFNNVSEEGIRTLRKRTGRKMEQPEEPPMIPCKSKERRGASIEMYSITALAESSKEGPDTQLGEREDKESTVFSRCRKRKRALTPPYIPEKGILQTWPKFGFENVSEGVRALRKRTGKMEHSEEPAMIPLRSKELKGALNEENFSTMPAESSVWGCIDKQDLKRRAPNGRLHNAPHSLRIRRQAAPTKAPDNGSPTTSDEDFTICKASLSAIPIRGTLAVQPTAVQRSQKPFNDTGNSPWRGCKGRGERPSSHNRQ